MPNVKLSIPGDTPICNPQNGRLNQEWRLWFNKLYNRAGSDDAPSNLYLANAVSQNTVDITTLKEKVNTLTNDLNDLTDIVNQNTNDITSLGIRVTTNESDISNLKINVSQNTTDISNLKTQVDSNTSNIASLNTQVGTNTTDITNLKNNTIQSVSNQGSGIGLFINKTLNTANFKSIKAGTNITLDNTTNPNELVINSTGGGGGYTLPPATTTTLGGIIVGSGLSVAVDGTLSNSYSYSLPIASSSVLGGIKVGSGLSIAGDGTLSASGGGSSNTVINGTSMSFAVNYDITAGGDYNFIWANSNLPSNSLSGSSDNIYLGYKTGLNNIAPQYNVLIGNRSGQFTSLNYCTAIGHDTLNRGADNNIAIGLFALNNVNTQQNIAIGQYALSYQRYSNCIGIGYGVTVTGNNQIQLGDSSTTVYCYGPVQDRSDARDKIDIQDSNHGLDFIKKLRARMWRWNHRERYSTPAMDENGKYYRKEVPNDGSRAGKRYHYGLIAQELQDILIKNNIDFGGFQDHNINNGEDVMSIGYNELIAPIIKAIQEQQEIIEQLQKDISQLKNINGV